MEYCALHIDFHEASNNRISFLTGIMLCDGANVSLGICSPVSRIKEMTSGSVYLVASVSLNRMAGFPASFRRASRV